jgi:hypothetical protein
MLIGSDFPTLAQGLDDDFNRLENLLDEPQVRMLVGHQTL